MPLPAQNGMDLDAISHSQLARLLPRMMSRRRPAFIQGPPGIGKSDAAGQFAAAIDADYITQSAIHQEPTDINGYYWPDHESGYLKRLLPELWKRIRESTKPYIVLNYDDLPTAPRFTQSALFRMMLEHTLGDLPLPANTYVLATGNRSIDAAAVEQMPTPLRNRMWHALLQPVVGDWKLWALKHGMPAELIAFIGLRPDLLFAFDKTRYAFPTPRTWAFVGEQIMDFAARPDPDIELEAYAGFVGKAAAIELMGYLKIFRAINIEAIMLSPRTADVPSDPSARYAISIALARRATQANLDTILTYANRMPEEYGVLTMVSAYHRDKKLTQTKAFIDWSVVHQDVLS